MVNQKQFKRNIEHLFALLAYLEISFCKDWVKEYLSTHKIDIVYNSYSKLMTLLNIDNKIIKIPHGMAHKLPIPFLIFLKNGQVIFVKGIVNSMLNVLNLEMNYELISLDNIKSVWDGTTIIINKKDNSGQYNFRKCKIMKFFNTFSDTLLVLFLFASVYSLFSTARFSLISLLLLLLNMIGLLASSALVIKELKQNTGFLDSICRINKTANCSLVTNSKTSEFLGIKFSDIGFVYFMGGIILVLLSVFYENHVSAIDFNTVLTILAAPYAFYSLYYQKFILKVWCPFCIIVQVVLIVEMILVAYNISFSRLVVFDLLKYVAIYIFIGIVWFKLKGYFKMVLSYKDVESALNFFEEKEAVQKILLNNSKEITGAVPKIFVIGNSTKNDLSLILSLTCVKCSGLFKAIYKMVVNKELNKAINIIFLTGSDDSSLPILKKMLTLYNRDPELGIKALAEWYDMDDKVLWDDKYHCEDDGLGQSPSIKEFSDFCKINSIGFSPALIWEGKLMPAYFVNPKKLKKLYIMK